MSFEEPIYSFNCSSGEPPTPTKTPTSPNFLDGISQTPRNNNVKFHDPLSPWTPSFGLGPAFRTPLRTTFGSDANERETINGQTDSVSSRNGYNEVANAQAASSPSLPEQSNQLLAAGRPPRDFHKASPRIQTSGLAEKTAQPDPRYSEEIHSMQTPPSTGTAASKRRAQEAQISTAQRRSFVGAGGEMSSPSFPPTTNAPHSMAPVNESPIHFPNLQFSPDGVGFLASGPATAPVYPQQKLFWDPEQSIDATNMDFSMDDSFTNFGLGLQRPIDPYAFEQQGTEMSLPPSNNALNSFSQANIPHFPPKQSIALNQTNVSASAAVMTQGSFRGKVASVVVNPSLLHSSPSRPKSSSGPKVLDDTLKPYAHQLQDAEIERGLRTRRPKRKRGQEVESPAVQAATLALREAEEEASQSSSEGVVTPSFGGPMRPRSQISRREQRPSRSSPERKGINRDLDATNSNLGQNKRASITLNIDASGRASTQTTFVDDPSSAHLGDKMDADADSDSSSTFSGEGMVFSQPPSFAYPVERAKKIRSDSHHGSSSHSQKSSYGSTLGNLTNASGSVHGDTARRPKQSRHGKERSTQVHFQEQPGPSTDSEAETLMDVEDDETGNAQAELMKVLQRRSSQKSNKGSFSHNASQSRPSQLRNSSSSASFMDQINITPKYNKNISPTTITDPDLSTPSTARYSSGSAGSTRCVCHKTESDGLMVQCESCQKWLHTRCVGLHEHNVPAVYLCIYCTGPTPNARGGRIREPARAAFPPPSSPLAYKSFQHE